MHVLVLIAAAIIGSNPIAAVGPSGKFTQPSEKCPKTASYQAFERGKSVKPRKLNELPPANAYSTVYRLVGGCEVPVVVRYNVGGR